jgi:hypothetical protein
MNLQGRDLKQDLSGEDVRLLHNELTQIKLVIPDAERQKALFGPGTRDVIAQFQKERGLPVTGVVDAVTAKAINQIVSSQTAPTFVVSGRVYDSSRAGVGGLALQVVDKNAGPDVPLASGSTDPSGSYSIVYPTAPVIQAGKSAPDIQIQVFVNKITVGSSDVRYDAKPAESLDVLLGSSFAVMLPTEFESLTGAITTHYKGQLGQLQEAGNRSDITYLANKTGWDARAVALAALADQFGQNAKIPSVYFYALFRAGLPANEDSLYRTDAGTLTTIWKQANAQGVIPETSLRALPEVLKQFQAIAAQKLLATPAVTGTSSFKDILTAVKLTDAQQQQFAELYTANRSDMPTFWKAVGNAFGQDLSNRLQVSGKLAFLTYNNASLMQAVSTALNPAAGISDLVQLAAAGYHRASQWTKLLTPAMPVPPQIPGDSPDAKRANYADFLATQLRLSYPTAAIAEMVKSGDLAVDAPDKVNAFLTANQGKFEIAVQPIEQYIAKNKLQVDVATVQQIKRLQRTHQITPNDQAMGVLLKNGMDAAYLIVQQDRKTFLDKFTKDLGGADAALQIYNKAVQIHGTVLNVAISYLTAKRGIQLGNSPLLAQQNGALAAAAPPPDNSGQILDPTPTGPTPANASDVIAYATLESLFGSMDFCSCDHCRSILSPAAYLVDLLLFIDKAADGKQNAQTVLLERRPDIQYLPLTCENTNTPMPYIDVVNETLEYFIANTVQPLSLQQYQGHDTDGTATEDLMASPQFVIDSAYATLLGEFFPTLLPFHQPLENLRRYFNKFEVTLQLAMERFRQTDNLERGGNPYAWRDILMEEIGLSREEYRLLTDSTLTLKQIYGFSAATTDATVADTLSNAKTFARRIGVSYDDLIAIVKTHFVNPNSSLIPKLEALQVSFGAIQALHDGTLKPADFLNLLPTGAGAPNPAEYGGDIVAWLTDPANYARIMGIITLTDPTNTAVGCNFDKLELRYSKPVANAADTSTRLGAPEFTRLLRFIRLWRKTGWTIEQTDAAICSFFRQDLAPIQSSDVDTLAKLDAGFLTLLPRLGIASRIMKSLALKPDRDFTSLLACWSNIGTQGQSALYRQMFLSPATLKQDPAFADNGYGEFLTDGTAKLTAHAETLRAAFNLTADEFDRIRAALGFDDNTVLSLANISAMYRRGWLARKLRLSVRELLLLSSVTGLDPFAPPDISAVPLAEPPMSRLISLVQALKARSLKTAVALYLIWNQDLSGKSAPEPAQVTEFARTLRGDFADIDQQFAATEDPNGDILRARMTLVYGQDTADAFFALLDNTITTDVSYTNPAPVLSAAVIATDSQLFYDDFRHRLSHLGLLSTAVRDALKLVAGVTADFKNAVDALYALGQDALGSFFSRYPELKPLYDTYLASPDPPAKKRTALLAAFQPELARLRKQEQALQRMSAAASLDLDSTRTLLDPANSPFPLHAAGQLNQPLLNDAVTIATLGLAAQFFYRDTATGAVDLAVPAANNLDYSPTNGNALPANPAPGSAISGIWQGFLETPDAGFYNLVIEADASVSVTLNFDSQAQPLVQNGTVWRNSNPLQLKAGTLYPITITVAKVTNVLRVSWETPKRPREVIPGRYLYPTSVLPPFSDAYVRFMKVASLLAGLSLTANEIARFGTNPDYFIGGDGWLNTLTVKGDPTAASAAALLKPFVALVDYSRIKSELSVTDESLLTVLKDPDTATANPNSLLFTLTFWDKTSLNDLLIQFGGNFAALGHFELFRRVYDAFYVIQTIGISTAKLVAATTNEPTAVTVRDLQSALRARYDESDWRDIIHPINDEMRSLQRDALVTYILHQMTENPATAQIDTPDKLFEYFLMDVQMQPCMQTSRIRHALSSIQLFIERCLMNLEPRVSPGSINVDYWKWMKRYRVWEANRKVFLFPENWLEPELRDDKSPIFKEIESQLLQSDITDDSAAAALLTYLSKLAEVAKLEPCGMYFEEKGSGPEDDVVHVVARSGGSHRKYHYRRFELGYWTAWEQIKLDIEDNPVNPVVWNNRLLLFWVKILKQSPLQQPAAPPAPNPDPQLSSATLTTLKQDAKTSADNNVRVTVQAVLYWSEYYNGQWQPAMTSNVGSPLDLGTFPPQGAGAFNRSTVRLRSDEPQSGQLRITVYGNFNAQAFALFNTHSVPQQGGPPSPIPPPFGPRRSFETNSSSFKIDYFDKIPDVPPESLQRSVLTDDSPDAAVQPNHYVPRLWDAPFFFEDRRNIFYVTTTEQPTWVGGYGGFGVSFDPGLVATRVPPLVVQTVPQRPPRFWGDGGPIGPDPGVIDPAPIRQLVTEDAYIKQGLATTASVQYGDKQIGPSGAISAQTVIGE